MRTVIAVTVTILIFVLLLSYSKHDPLSAQSPVSPLHTPVPIEQMRPSSTPTPPPNAVVITDFGTRSVTIWHVLLAVVVTFLILFLVVRLIDVIRSR